MPKFDYDPSERKDIAIQLTEHQEKITEEAEMKKKELEVQNDARLYKNAGVELDDIWDNLKDPRAKNHIYPGRWVADPEILESRIFDIRADISNIKDKLLREKLEQRVNRLEGRIYLHYIPYIEDMLKIFGRNHSPLQKTHRSSYRVTRDDVYDKLWKAVRYADSYADAQKQMGRSIDLTEFLDYIENLKSKLQNYQKEPILYDFETETERLITGLVYKDNELSEEMHRYKDGDLISLEQTDTEEKIEEQSHDPWYNPDTETTLEDLLNRSMALFEIVGQMTDANIKNRSQSEAQNIYNYAERIAEKTRAPKQLLVLEAEIRYLFRRKRSGEIISNEDLADIKAKFNKIKEVTSPTKIVDAISPPKYFTKMLKRLEKNIAQIESDANTEDSEDTDYEELRDLTWAFKLLGVQPTLDFHKIKTAYRTQSTKHHPDITGQDNRSKEDSMRRINEAYGAIKKKLDRK